MRRLFGSTAILALALACALAPARAQDTKPTEEKAEQKMMKEEKPATGVRAEILRQIDDAQKKLAALADAMPAEKYTWRPGQGVRSVGEVFAHVAGGNYFLPTFWGVKPPAGVDPRGFEKEGGDKAKTVENLKKSFDHARQAIQSVPDADLDKAIKLFGRDGTTREAFMLVATHAHEHLGQSIAYARMNGVTPPWSAQGQ
ncbi:MAG TPA: DinB family protein [Thermoanaerobaculia bacterium]|jgi:uncharacterized damage-inducible protein DinB